jgi:hypothetical protein
MTLNEIIGFFQAFKDVHLQVKYFIFGDSSYIDNVKDIDGAVMWVFVAQNSGRISETSLTYSFNVGFMDVLNKDDENMQDVLSDTLQIATDFAAWLDRYSEGAYEYTFTRASNINAFRDKFESEYAGHIITVDIELPYPYDKCQIPTSSGGSLPTECEVFLQRLSSYQWDCIENSGHFETTVNVYVNGVLNQTATIDPLVNNTINIEP